MYLSEIDYERISKATRIAIKNMGVSKWHELSDILMFLFTEQSEYENTWDFLYQQSKAEREVFDKVHPSKWYLKLSTEEWISEALLDVSESTMRSHLKKLHTLGLVQKRVDYDGVAEYRCDTESIERRR